jgi:UPF0716 family protein affecting phage T7 exclusion
MNEMTATVILLAIAAGACWLGVWLVRTRGAGGEGGARAERNAGEGPASSFIDSEEANRARGH